jgi:hypothetical protein
MKKIMSATEQKHDGTHQNLDVPENIRVKAGVMREDIEAALDEEAALQRAHELVQILFVFGNAKSAPPRGFGLL